eukprot:s4707_g3.t1
MAGDDSVHVRQALTYVIPTATIVDFYTESDYTPSTLQFRFVQHALLARRYEDTRIDERGIHFRIAALQPDMPFAIQVAAVNHTWYRAVLPIVEQKPWISSWRTMRSMMAKNLSITVQVFASSIAATAKEELSLPIYYDDEIVVPRARAPLGTFAQATQARMGRRADTAQGLADYLSS